MKKTLLSFIKNNYTWLIAMFLSFAFFTVYMILHSVKPFGNNTIVVYDGAAQVMPFLSELYRKIINGENILYSWHGGLGCNFLALYFYYLASPINLLVIFSRGNIEGFMIFSIISRIILSAGTFGFFLSRKDGVISHNIFIIPISLAYSLSSYMLVYYHESMWLDSIVLFPIIMYGYIILMRERKPFCYIISLGLCALSNFYITVMIAIFLVLWFIFDEFDSYKDFITKGLYFVFSSLIAAGISSVSIIVSYMAVLDSHVSSESIPGHSWFGSIFEVLRYLYIFSKPHALGTDVKLNYTNLYAGTFTIVFIFCYFWVKGDKSVKKIKRMIVFILLLLSMNESILNYIWHSFHIPIGVPNRFSFIFVFILLLFSFDFICNIEKKSIKRIAIGCICASILPLLNYFFIDFDSIIQSKQILQLSMILCFVYSVCIILISYFENRRALFSIIITVFMVIELMTNGLVCLSQVVDYSPEFVELKNTPKENAVKFIMNNNKNDFFRMDIYGKDTYNGGFLYGCNGVEIFSSIFSEGVKNCFVNVGVSAGNNGINSMGYPEFFDNIVSEKYIVVDKAEDCFKQRSDYNAIYDKDDVIVYENTNVMPLGFSVSKNIIGFKSSAYNPYLYINDLAYNMFDSQNVYIMMKPDYQVYSNSGTTQLYESDYLFFDVLEQDVKSRLIYIDYLAEEDGNYYIYFEDKQRGTVSCLVNGNISRSNLKTNELSYVGDIKIGDEITVSFENSRNTNISAVNERVYMYSVLLNQNEMDNISRQSNNTMTLSDMKNNSFIGTITINEGQMLFTSIPYDEGWHIYENGTEVKKEKVMDAFIGINLGTGNHTLEFIYIPKGLILGIIISITSLVVFILYCLIFYRSKIKGNKDKKQSA